MSGGSPLPTSCRESRRRAPAIGPDHAIADAIEDCLRLPGITPLLEKELVVNQRCVSIRSSSQFTSDVLFSTVGGDSGDGEVDGYEHYASFHVA